ncbi:hypothetical protein [Acidovorax sp. NCPPB 3576]|uniref:hypothetical protein n=1 Tax=Acidovorax sp. NCPPB 3576 TaxID=2940488 RepID=UPI002349C659|nr:hypothetical protein [Acidovorax sp. NCPPB 3576]WCM86861.1 hypothetical protein M5C98_15930 [Acidovorax sp. NCPPB 3576]
MSVVQLPLARAIDIPVLRTLPLRMARSLVTQYWRRAHMLTVPAHRLQALAVFDEGIVQSLASLKLHLAQAPAMEADFHAEIAASGHELQQEGPAVFAHACIEVLKLQLGRPGDVAPALWNDHLQTHPSAVFNALRFCFDDAVGAYLAPRAEQAVAQNHPSLVRLLMRLAIARPGVCDAYAQALNAMAEPMPGGMPALCQWRCLGQGDEAKALQALETSSDADAALVALALMGSSQQITSAKALLARAPDSSIALGLCAAGAGHDLAVALRAGRFPAMAWSQQIYAAALVGDGPLLRHLAAHTPWDDELACRALADSVALLTGVPCDGLFDRTRPAGERAQWADSTLEALPATGPALRLGLPRQTVVLGDAATRVGTPLRQLLYIEQASRMSGALWIEADDLASVQALALTTASVFERAVITGTAP